MTLVQGYQYEARINEQHNIHAGGKLERDSSVANKIGKYLETCYKAHEKLAFSHELLRE